MKHPLTIFFVILLALTPAIAQTLGNNGQGPFVAGGAYSYNQFLGPFFQSPFFSFSPNSLTVTWTAGTIYAGNGPVSVAAGSVALTGSKTTCAASTLILNTDSCNYIYSNATGTVATSVNYYTASSAGNSILAMAVTSSTGVTSLQAPYQASAGGNAAYSQIFPLTVNNTPSATAASIQTVAQTFTYTGLVTGDQVWLILQPAPTSLCPATSVRATGTNTLSIYFTTLTAVACTPAAGNYTILVIR
jgi:hypothetical protein